MIGKSPQLSILELLPQVDEPNTTTIVGRFGGHGRPGHYTLAATKKSKVTRKQTRGEEKDRAVVYLVVFFEVI